MHAFALLNVGMNVKVARTRTHTHERTHAETSGDSNWDVKNVVRPVVVTCSKLYLQTPPFACPFVF